MRFVFRTLEFRPESLRYGPTDELKNPRVGGSIPLPSDSYFYTKGLLVSSRVSRYVNRIGSVAISRIDLLPLGNVFHSISEQRLLLVCAQFAEGHFTRIIVNFDNHEIGPELLSRTKVQHGCRFLLLGLARFLSRVPRFDSRALIGRDVSEHTSIGVDFTILPRGSQSGTANVPASLSLA
jgi:hypothetical protein